MDLINFGLIFAIIILAMMFRKPLYVSIGAAMLATIFLYKVPIQNLGSLFLTGVFGKSTINLLLAFYAITFLQRMLEKRDRLTMAEMAVSNLFENRRVNAMFVPFLIGFLPSPGAVLIAKPIVDKAAASYLNREERTFVTSYYRHISEAFLPTYASIILAIQLSGVSVAGFVGAMLPFVVILFVLGYILYVRRIPKATGRSVSADKKQDLINFFRGVWPIILSVVLIVVLGLPVYLAIVPVIVLYYFAEKFTLREIVPFFKRAFELRMTLIVLFVMNFKEVLNYTGMIARLPAYLTGQFLPPVFIFGLLMFFGTLIAGTQAMIAIVIPMAFAAVPAGGVALLVLLMSLSYLSMQISPTHVCLGIVTEAYGTSFGSLVKKTMPVLVCCVVICFAYFYLLQGII